MTDLLRKPKRTSTALSSILRAHKTVIVDGQETGVRKPVLKIWEMPGWLEPIARIVAEDNAIQKAGGKSYLPIQRILLGSPREFSGR